MRQCLFEVLIRRGGLFPPALVLLTHLLCFCASSPLLVLAVRLISQVCVDVRIEGDLGEGLGDGEDVALAAPEHLRLAVFQHFSLEPARVCLCYREKLEDGRYGDDPRNAFVHGGGAEGNARGERDAPEDNGFGVDDVEGAQVAERIRVVFDLLERVDVIAREPAASACVARIVDERCDACPLQLFRDSWREIVEDDIVL